MAHMAEPPLHQKVDHLLRINCRCYQRSEEIPCKEPCRIQLECEHQCAGSCGLCFSGRLHAACKSDCGRTLVCGHQCTEPCTNQCPPCSRPCENRCMVLQQILRY